MAHDQELNERIREILKGTRGITEQNTFGGLCFLHYGNMVCGGDVKHGLMVRVGADNYEKYLKLEYAREMKFTGRAMTGLITVDPEGYRTKAQLKRWVERGLEFTSTLPKKKKKKKKKKKAKRKKKTKKR